MSKQTQVSKPPRSIVRLFPQVTSCEDAVRPIEVVVTEKDCAKGRKMATDDCALARAVKREFKANGAVIGMTRSYVIKGNRAIRFDTPPAVSREIVSFDRHHDFAPGVYPLYAVRPSQRRQRPPSKRKRYGITKRVVHKQTVRVRSLRDE